MGNPLISIITVTYNAEEFLEKTIESVLVQEYDNYEYIIIDGGSKDGTLNIIQKYESEITTWVSEKDKGIYDAMNKGVRYAKGKYLNFMNAGDTLFDRYTLSKVARAMEEQPNKEIYYGKYVLFADGKNPIKYIQGREVTQGDVYTSIPICHQAMFVGKDLFAEIGDYKLEYPTIAEVEWLVKLVSKRGNIDGLVFIDEPIVEYLLEGNSFKFMIKGQKEFMKISKSYLDKGYQLKNQLRHPFILMKSHALLFLNNYDILNRYRTIKYRLANRMLE